MTRTFNLAEDPWIPVSYRDGRRADLSVRDALRDAGLIRRIGTGQAEETVSVLRLLAAVLIRANSGTPDPVGSWRAQWRAGELDMPPVDRYLDRWADRFDLFDPARPFMQSPGLQCRIRPASDLMMQHAMFADTHTPTLSPAVAAIRLLTLNNFDGGGIKAADPHDARANKGRLMPPPGLLATGTLGRAQVMWPEYPTLARTLLANSPMTAPDGRPVTGPSDLPCWERDPLTLEEVGGAPAGIADRLTLQTRRTLLVPGPGGDVSGFMVSYGRVADLAADPGVEPHYVWSLDGTKPSGVFDQSVGMPLWWSLAYVQSSARRPAACEWARLLAGDGTPMSLNRILPLYRQGVVILALDHAHAMLPTGVLADPWAGGLLMRGVQAVRAYERFTADLTARWTPGISQHTVEDTALRLSPVIIRLLQERPADPYDTVRRLMRDWANALCLQHPVGSAPAYFTFLASLKRIGEQDPAPASPAPAGGGTKRHASGRTPRPVTRHGGGLPDETFPGPRDAVSWLQAHGKPKAQPSGIYLAISKQTMAYGYRWSRQEETTEEN